MQQVDKVVGVPIAWVLGFFTQRSKTLAGDRKPSRPKRVICTKFVGLGSVTLALPMLKALKESGIEVAFWTFSSQAELLKISGYVDHVWIVKPSLIRFPLSMLQCLWRAIRFKADAFLDMEQTSNCSAILARLSGAPVRVGFLCGKPVRESLFTNLVSLTAGRHMCESILLMAHAIGVNADLASPLPAPRIPHFSQTHADGASQSKVIVVNINTSDLGQLLRQWPDSHWVSLCCELLKDSQVQLVFPGVQSEAANNQRVIEQIIVAEGESVRSRIVNLAGKSSLTELMVLLKDAHLAISVDSGVMHLAAWAGTPVIGLFGPETPQLYAPRSKRSKVIWAALPCSPCCTVATEKHTRCRDNQCMKKIAPDQVLMASRALIQEIDRGQHPLVA
jgi:lipopolysaccharide heptosyltransferase II